MSDAVWSLNSLITAFGHSDSGACVRKWRSTGGSWPSMSIFSTSTRVMPLLCSSASSVVSGTVSDWRSPPARCASPRSSVFWPRWRGFTCSSAVPSVSLSATGQSSMSVRPLLRALNSSRWRISGSGSTARMRPWPAMQRWAQKL